MTSSQAFICDAVRTPFGRYGGALSSVRADDLGAVPLRALMARHAEVEFLLRVGEYQSGSDPLADQAIARSPAMRELLCQGADEATAFAYTVARLRAAVDGPGDAKPATTSPSKASWSWAWRSCCRPANSGTACAGCARTTPATT